MTGILFSSQQYKISLKEIVSKILIFSLLLAFVALLQYYFDIKKIERPVVPPTVLPAQALKFVDLGLDSALSSFLWVYSVQQVTEHPQELPRLIETVNDLDPKFSYPYAFSALVLPALGLTNEAIEIGQSGIKNADPDWRIPYYLATTYHIFLNDRKNAAYYFDLAAQTQGAEEVAKVVASRYGTRSTVREQTKEIWSAIYETSTDEIIKERAKNYLIQIEILEFLEEAVLRYKQKFGYYPQNMEDLVTGRVIKAIPLSPFGLQYLIDADGKIMVN